MVIEMSNRIRTSSELEPEIEYFNNLESSISSIRSINSITNFLKIYIDIDINGTSSPEREASVNIEVICENVFLERKKQNLSHMFSGHKESYKKIKKDSDEICPICLDTFKENLYTRTLICKHIYHKKCIDKWLKTMQTCPVCRCDPFLDP